MSDLSLSYRKVRYDLRPAKQAERLILIDALRRLSTAGFPITEYQYTGMGSVHFYDFSLFHRYAGIQEMWSVEASNKVRRRVKFNRPYAFIKIHMNTIGAVIPQLPRTRPHLIWLDYDSFIQPSYVADVTQAIAQCMPGSMVLVTVDVEPKRGKTTAEMRELFEVDFGDLVPANLRLVDFAPKRLPRLSATLLKRACDRGLDGRAGVQFKPLFNFLYQDGHRMLTYGGMVVDKAAGKLLQKSSLQKAKYIRKRVDSFFQIHMPVLTRREQLLLDAAMPIRNKWQPKEFEITSRDLRAYRDIYQYAPHYAELIV